MLHEMNEDNGWISQVCTVLQYSQFESKPIYRSATVQHNTTTSMNRDDSFWLEQLNKTMDR